MDVVFVDQQVNKYCTNLILTRIPWEWGLCVMLLLVDLQANKCCTDLFWQGTLVKSLKAGDWVLLDEINLATAETLECLSGLLESTEGSVILMERG